MIIELAEYFVHLFAGFTVALMVFRLDPRKKLSAFAVVFMLALGKELYDHYVFVWHFYDCIPAEHFFDVLFTLGGVVPAQMLIEMPELSRK